MIYDLQKASMWKRISAGLFDIIILVIAVVGFATVISIICGYDQQFDKLMAGYEKYEKLYGVEFELTAEESLELTEEELQQWNTAYEALIQDTEVMRVYNLIIQLTFLIITFAVLAAYLVLEFAVPMFLGNGQTLGKKIFGIGVMRVDGIKVVGPLMFIRTILGKYTLETMIPVYLIYMSVLGQIGILGPIIIGLILLVQIILMIATRTNSMIHDVLAKTVTVDLASQMIFDSEADLIAYKEKVHAEQAARQTY